MQKLPKWMRCREYKFIDRRDRLHTNWLAVLRIEVSLLKAACEHIVFDRWVLRQEKLTVSADQTTRCLPKKKHTHLTHTHEQQQKTCLTHSNLKTIKMTRIEMDGWKIRRKKKPLNVIVQVAHCTRDAWC